uniref:Uncharacterized protein n=7 Tax=Percomorphaceae TaxID=1489872 RepID=A0A3P9Q8F6_POERE
MSVGGCACP